MYCHWYQVRLRTCLPWIWCVALQMAFVSWITPAQGMVLVEAHRGYSGIAPENTLASIRAGEGIADLTEWDVRMTADGAFVLMHDSTVDRTTNGTGAVSALSLEQIQSLDAGAWFSTAFAGEPVPTMAEAIAQAAVSGITPLIEVKAGSPAAYHNEFLSLGVDPSQFRLISFDWNFLLVMNSLDPAYNLGALGSGELAQSTINNLSTQGIDFIDWNHISVTQSTVNQVHASDMELHVWTVNDAGRMQQLIDIGVDGITTDQPATLNQLVIASSRTADLSGDQQVNEVDWNLFNFGRGLDLSGLSKTAAYELGDMDGDFDNDIADFVRFKQLYLQSTGDLVAAAPNAVPEPRGTLFMVFPMLLVCSTRCIPEPSMDSGRQ